MKRITILLIAVLLIAGACSREIEKPTKIEPSAGTVAGVSNLTLAVGDGVLTVTWDLGNGGAVDKYLLYRSDTTAQNFRLYDSTETTSYEDRNVQNSLRYYYRVSVVTTTGIEGLYSEAVSGVPGLFSIRVANGNEFTRTRQVAVEAVYPNGTSHIMLSNSADFSGALWLNAVLSVSWELPDADGIHTIYAKFKMQDGNESSMPYTDDIILDRHAVIETFESDDGGEVLTADDVIHFRMVTGESGGTATVEVPEVGTLDLFDNGTMGDAVADDGTYELNFTIPPGVEFENGVVTGSFVDQAGNNAPEAALDHVLIVRTPPLPVTLYLNGAFESMVELGWSASTADDFASYRIYRSQAVPVTANSDFVSKLNSKTQLTVTDTNVVPAETYYYVVITVDASGLAANSNTLEVTTPANEKPDAVVLAYEKTDSTSYKLTWTRNRDADFESYRVFRSTSSDVSNTPENLVGIVNLQTSTTYSGDDEGEVYYYAVYVYDRYGLASDRSNVVPSE